MAEPQAHHPVKLFVAILTPQGFLEEAEATLEQVFGPLDLQSPALPFLFTDYYEAEMGTHLLRKFVAFSSLIPQEGLVDIKHRTNAMESGFASFRSGKMCRRVNLDPGYLTAAKVVLASTKDYAHRISLGQGIFADLHLTYEHGAYQPLPWTYPDYRTPEALAFFAEARRLYLTRLKAR
jgi:hypothetical protein